MIARIELEYGTGREKLVEFANASAENREVIRRIFPDIRTFADQAVVATYDFGGTYIIDLETDGRWLTDMGAAFTVRNFKGTVRLTAIAPETKHATTVYVQVPHIGLLTINEVEVRTDYCTEMLQKDLNDGWRILCVCPPNAQRRPDYILGRTAEKA